MYQQINLYQPIFRKEHHLLSALTVAQAAGLLLVTLVSIYGFAAWNVLGLEAEVVQLEQREQAYAEKVQRLGLGSDAERRERVEAELQAVNAQLARQQELVEILEKQEFGGVGGFSSRLTALAHTQVTGLWLTRVAMKGGVGAMQLAGESLFAGLVPEYLQLLSQEPAMAGVGFASLEIERIPESTKVSFNVSSRTLLNTKRSSQFAGATP